MMWLRIKALFKRRQLERDLDDELSFHLAMRRQKLEAEGVPDATNATRRRFGNVTAMREACREAWTFASFEGLARDVRYSVRTLAGSPGFTAVAVATLALGIGANTAIFSLVNAIVLKALPYERPQDLYAIHELVRVGSQRSPAMPVNAGNFLLWRKHARSFSAIAALEPTNDSLIQGSELIQMHGLRVSANFFPMLGIRPQIGRSFLPEEDYMGHGWEMILTEPIWRQRFHSDPNIVGRQVSMNGYPASIVGVLPASFYFPKQDQLFTTPIAGWTWRVEYFSNLSLLPDDTQAGVFNFNFASIARLKAGFSRDQATADRDAIEAGIAKGNPDKAVLSTELAQLQTAVLGPAQRQLWMLMAGAGIVLLVVCFNLAGLLLARHLAREHEVAIRTALGAARADLLRQFLVEGLLLALVGGACGVAAALAGIRLLVRAAPVALPRLESVAVDGRILLFSVVASLGAGLLMSMLPALRFSSRQAADALKSAPAGSVSRRASRLHQTLAASEIALCTVLLVSALLLARSFGHVFAANAWLNVDRVFTLDLLAPPLHYNDQTARQRLYQRLTESIRTLPGVSATGIVNALPLRGETFTATMDFVEIPGSSSQNSANFHFMTPGYFKAVGLPVLQGRSLSDADAGKHVLLISESAAAELPSGRSPLGLHMKWTTPMGAPLLYQVVGIVRDAHAKPEEKASPAVYLPYWDWPPWQASVVVRTSADPRAVAEGVQRVIRNADPLIGIPHAETMREILDSAVAPRRFLTWLGMLFALSATCLAALGLYGVVSLAAARRRHEIGVRMALGAHAGEVVKMVVSQAVLLALAGVAIGLVCALAVTRLLTSLLYDVRPSDPASFAVVSVTLIAVALLASFIPARRAARVDPLAAIRYE